ncbi:RsmD family RNA methyltransferase [Candidatus Omnitrophota bacterium]
MRIIAGKYKSRLIKAPKNIRPTQDKVRKALFDILGDVEGLIFLELFAGTGAVGIEALSRGARGLTLVEREGECNRMIEKNLRSLGIEDCQVLGLTAQEAIIALQRLKKTFNIIFLDPPYEGDPSPRFGSASLTTSRSGPTSGRGETLAKKTLQALSAYDILSPYGLVVVQHFKKDILPETLGVLSLLKQKKYGDTLLSFYRGKDD